MCVQSIHSVTHYTIVLNYGTNWLLIKITLIAMTRKFNHTLVNNSPGSRLWRLLIFIEVPLHFLYVYVFLSLSHISVCMCARMRLCVYTHYTLD